VGGRRQDLETKVSKIASLSSGLPRIAEEHVVILNGLSLTVLSTVVTVAALVILRSLGVEMVPVNEFALPGVSM